MTAHYRGGPRDGELFLPTNENWNKTFIAVRILPSGRQWYAYSREPGCDWQYVGTMTLGEIEEVTEAPER